MTNTTKCFCCGILFSPSFKDGLPDWPATKFIATGNWGSTIIDGPESQSIIIRICDKCVLERKSLADVVNYTWPDKLRKDVENYINSILMIRN